MKKCPYCCEVLEPDTKQCGFCQQFIIDPLIEAEFKSRDKKNCIFCGNKIIAEAVICRHCHKWLDQLDNEVERYGDAEE